MKYEQIDNRSFRLTDESSSDKFEFHMRDTFTLWQLKQMGLYYAELTKSCTKMGATVISMVLGIIGVANTNSFNSAADALTLITDKTLGDIGLIGSGELMEFLCKNSNLERLAAILFLKPNERFPGDKGNNRFDSNDLQTRIDLFDNQLEFGFVIGAAQDFFGKRLESFGITLSRLKTFVKQKIELAIQTSDGSTPTSENGTDTSMPLPMDTPSESPT